MRHLLLLVLLAGSAQAGIISGGGPTDALSAATAAGTYVKKAGDTMTGRLTAPDATLTYGLTAATGSFTTKLGIGTNINADGEELEIDSANPLILIETGNAADGYMGASAAAFSGGLARYLGLRGELGVQLGVGGTVGATLQSNGLAVVGSVTAGSSVTIRTPAAGTGLLFNPLAAISSQIRYEESGAFKAASGFDTTEEKWYANMYGNATRGLAVDSNNNVLIPADKLGIGIAAPASKLHMSSGTLTVDGNQSGDVLTVRSNLSNADLHFLLETTGTGGSESSRIDLKTTNRHWLIQNAKGLSNGFAIRDETAGSATRLFIDDAGKVGINTTSPCSTCTLHVAGGASVTGAFAVASDTLTVATTGIVSAPSQPAVRATDGAGISLPNGAVTQVYFGVDDYDRQNMHDVTNSSGNFVVPTGGAGLYYLNAGGTFAVDADGGRQVYIFVDGVEKLQASSPVSSAGFSTIIHATGVLSLTAGQVVTVKAYQSAGNALTFSPISFTMVKLW